MLTTIKYRLEKVKYSPTFLYCSVWFYRVLRLQCCRMEDKHFGIYEEAGFKVGINWTEDLGTDQEQD